MIELEWHWKQFQDLTVYELYELLKLRQDVFVVEQNCVYADIDGVDNDVWHLLGLKDQALCAYARVIPPNKKRQVSIGRVISNQTVRGQGLGKQVMQQSLDFIKQQNYAVPIKISAQQHLEKFYSEFGFTKASKPYDEDGIMHIDMTLTYK